ncbi:unnamed protein product [Arctogadus glacialis]
MATASMASFNILYSHKIPPHSGTQRRSSVLHEIRLSGLGAKPPADIFKYLSHQQISRKDPSGGNPKHAPIQHRKKT